MSGCGLAANELLSERLATAHGQLAWAYKGRCHVPCETAGGQEGPQRRGGGRAPGARRASGAILPRRRSANSVLSCFERGVLAVKHWL